VRSEPAFSGAADAKGLERFRLAVLKVSGGDMERFHRAILTAKYDWRDLLTEAEHPREWQLDWNKPEATEEEYTATREADRQEYLASLREGEE
jgi:hypothetical protein